MFPEESLLLAEIATFRSRLHQMDGDRCSRRSLRSISLPDTPPCPYAFTSLMLELNTSKKQLKNLKLPISLIIVTKRISHPHVFPLYYNT